MMFGAEKKMQLRQVKLGMRLSRWGPDEGRMRYGCYT